MEDKINKFFCIQPFVNVTTRIKGQNNVCCNISSVDSNIKHESPHEFFNSQKVKNFRESLLRGEKRNECRLCHYLEHKSKNSHRMEYNKYYNIKNDQDNQYYKEILERLRISTPKNPLYFEMHVSNLCNLKCLTCNEFDSSRFHAENKALGVSIDNDANYSRIDENKIVALESAISDQLLFLDIRGGETLMVPEVKKILKEVDTTRASNITLKIQTNGTIMPDNDWTSIFKKFKNTKVNLSVDAFGDDNNYLRYPADWNTILHTIDYLKSNDIKFIINTVISNLNLLLLDKLFNWIQKEGYLNYFYILHSPDIYQPNNLPKDLLDISKKRLQNVKTEFVNQESNKKLSDLMTLCDEPGTKSNWKNFCDEIQMRDTYRKNNITNIIPEIKEYLYA